MRVAIYLRVASSLQTDINESLIAQREACRGWIEENNHEFVAEYVDAPSSGLSVDNRNHFQSMISEATQSDSRRFDIVLVEKYSRFSRCMEDDIKYRAALAQHGVALLSVVAIAVTGGQSI